MWGNDDGLAFFDQLEQSRAPSGECTVCDERRKPGGILSMASPAQVNTSGRWTCSTGAAGRAEMAGSFRSRPKRWNGQAPRTAILRGGHREEVGWNSLSGFRCFFACQNLPDVALAVEHSDHAQALRKFQIINTGIFEIFTGQERRPVIDPSIRLPVRG